MTVVYILSITVIQQIGIVNRDYEQKSILYEIYLYCSYITLQKLDKVNKKSKISDRKLNFYKY